MLERLRNWLNGSSTVQQHTSENITVPENMTIPVDISVPTPGSSGDGIATLRDVAAAFHGTLLRPQDRESSLSSELELAVYKDVLKVLREGVHPEDLPKLPAAVSQLLFRLRDEKSNTGEITRLINQDPVLASSVLKVANSPYYITGDEEISNIEQAVSRLGMDRLSAITLSILMRPVFDVRPIYFKHFSKYLWQHSQDCAHACAELARQSGDDYFTAYLVGLVHDIGKLVIFQALMKAMKLAHPDVHPDPKLIGVIVDRTALQLSCVSLKHWDLPKSVQIAVCDQNRAGCEPEMMKDLSSLLYIGNLMSEMQILLTEGRVEEDVAEALLRPHGVSLETMRKIFGQ